MLLIYVGTRKKQETYSHVGHGTQIVNLVRLDGRNNVEQVRGIGQVAVMKEQTDMCLLKENNPQHLSRNTLYTYSTCTYLMAISIQMVNSSSVK